MKCAKANSVGQAMFRVMDAPSQSLFSYRGAYKNIYGKNNIRKNRSNKDIHEINKTIRSNKKSAPPFLPKQ